MALKPCQGCGKQVDTSAKACPQCGRPSPTASGFVRWLAGAFVVTLMVGGTVKACSCAGDAVDSARSAATAPTRRQQEPPIQVSAAKLHADYAANEVSADEAYKGRTLVVDGNLRSINKDAFGSVVLMLAGGGMLEDVRAELRDSEAPKASALKKRQRVEVTCKGGGRILISAMLKDCEITATWK